MTPLNRPISPNRRFALATGDLAAVKRAGRAAGATVNDALLAIVAGMLRRYLEAAGRRCAGEPGGAGPGQRPGGAGRRRDRQPDLDRVRRPAGREPDPIERIRAISVQTRALKDSAAVRAGALMVGASGWAPPLISGLLARAMGSVRAFNLVVSNIPGPQQPFYLSGVRLNAVHPVVPLNPANQGLTVGIISYDGGSASACSATATSTRRWRWPPTRWPPSSPP